MLTSKVARERAEEVARLRRVLIHVRPSRTSANGASGLLPGQFIYVDVK